MTNLLVEPSIRVRLADGGTSVLSLPELYPALADDRIASFPALRPHQRHAWHAFLAQLGAMAMHAAACRTPPTDAERWLALLRGLTPDHPDDEPWRLVVDNPDQPAFLQCPAPRGLGDYRGRVATPDDIDILVTAKNHDVKQAIAGNATPEDWVFALIDLQTMAGFLGAGNYGIARMNGGFSARPCLGLAPAEGGVGAHLFHDIDRMIAGRDSLLEDYPHYYQSENGIALLWLEPWLGTESADLTTLDPYFIEICRRVRMREESGAMVAWTASSKKPRVAAKPAKGNLGDFWTPVDNKETKALSVSSGGFSYKRLVDLMLDAKAYRPPPAMSVGDAPSGRWRLVARSVAGGQGKTDGYHERTDIAFAHRTAFAFGSSERDRLAEIAERQIREIDEIGGALRFGIAVAASGGKDSGDLKKTDRAHATPYVRRLEAVADARFFAALEDRFLADDEAVPRARFARRLIQAAHGLLDEASASVPCASIYRHRARAQAERAFRGRLHSPRSVFSDQPEILNTKEVHDAR